MNIVQKLKVDKELTGNLGVIVRDETGVYGVNNLTGYGGDNGNPPSKFQRYIFDLVALCSNTTYRQIQQNEEATDVSLIIAEPVIEASFISYNPDIPRIVSKENITIAADNFDLDIFADGVYKLFMGVQIVDIYTADATIGLDILSNVQNAQYLYNTFKHIIINDKIYGIQNIIGSDLVLDKPFEYTDVIDDNSIEVIINPILSTYQNIIISDTLNDDIDNSIAKLSKSCNCDNKDMVNILSEVELYYWGMNRALDKNDFFQACEHFNMAKDLMHSLNCKCNG